jgi:D-3-phosphoglycerate dehydrogenase / 2-oxoglutarate reductase
VSTVLITDVAWESTAIEEEVLSAVGARILLARSGEEAELLQLVSEADAILTCFRSVTGDVIRAGRRLQVIGRYGVGTDNIAVDVATEIGIPVTNVPVYCVDEVVEHVLALMLNLARGIGRYDAAVRRDNWALSAGAPLHRLSGTTLGIVGLGQIGSELARRASAIGLHVIAHDERATAARSVGAEATTLEELAARSDFVSLHCPLTEQTRHLIDSEFLAAMKPTAYLLNAARGPIVDQAALSHALSRGDIAGAGLDVFESEPVRANDPLLASDRVLATPHVAFYSEESLAELARRAARSVAAVLRGDSPDSVVNPEVLSLSRWQHLSQTAHRESQPADGMLSVSNVVEYLASRHFLDRASARAQVLDGGVSGTVIVAGDGTREFVVKQALARLRTDDPWHARVERTQSEAIALQLAHRLIPGSVPPLVNFDETHQVLLMERAPATWVDWKSKLLNGDIDPATADWVGGTLAILHTETVEMPLPPLLESTETFDALRLGPFYRTVAARAPEHAGRIYALLNGLRARCLVHGDLSPKNILVGPEKHGWIIDFEAAHRGDPCFDVAFLLTHLTLKAVHRPQSADRYDRCVTAFLAAYFAGGGWVEPRDTLAHVGVLLLARVGGKSPAEYLSPADRGRVWRLGAQLLDSPGSRLGDLITTRLELLS